MTGAQYAVNFAIGAAMLLALVGAIVLVEAWLVLRGRR